VKIVRKSCPNPFSFAESGFHHHWSIELKRSRITWTGWFDYDRVNFGAPIEMHIFGPKRTYLIRPFSKSQGWDWEANKAADWRDAKNWHHIVVKPSVKRDDPKDD
jgi:hypothetical protein